LLPRRRHMQLVQIRFPSIVQEASFSSKLPPKEKNT
jgi:hypothetical protein